VSGDFAIGHDGLFLCVRAAEHLRPPVRPERLTTPRRKGRHPVRSRLSLMLEEDRKILVSHVTQRDVHGGS
jgi:hypothetical protein